MTQFTFTIARGERDRNRNVLRRFLPPQIIDQMVDDPETKLGLGGKRRPVVVLFADVRGFSGFAERRTPEETVKGIAQPIPIYRLKVGNPPNL